MVIFVDSVKTFVTGNRISTLINTMGMSTWDGVVIRLLIKNEDYVSGFLLNVQGSAEIKKLRVTLQRNNIGFTHVWS